jgi:alpha-glucan,water dikinase
MSELQTKEEIKTENGYNIKINALISQGQINISIEIDSDKKAVFHWGLYRHDNPIWHIPLENTWPKDSISYKNKAVQSPFISKDGKGLLEIKIDNYKEYSFIPFALYFPDTVQWENNHGQNYLINIPQNTSKSPLNYLKDKLDPSLKKETLFSMQYRVERLGDVCAIVDKTDTILQLKIASDINGQLLLHWGIINRFKNQWQLPDQSLRPLNTTPVCSSSVETLLVEEDGYKTITFTANIDDAPDKIAFVIRRDYDQWLKNNGSDFIIPFGLLVHKDKLIDNIELTNITNEIIKSEMGNNSWTLMHRFNLCHDLINKCGDNIEVLAYLYVWLRFSELRQLDWQRNYNTQPRELAHSMDRLTLSIAWLYIDKPSTRQVASFMLSSLGPGGDGQRIRDEILQIMHRHRIKEVSGSFLEEWHQKLHNNTTPDDVVICQAYIAYLQSNGNLDTFYQTLNQGGVTKKRLETFERPIKTPPDFAHYLKDALIHDFEFFLLILKKVHVGSDLQSSIEASGNILSDYINGRLWFLFDNRLNQSMPMEEQIGTVFFIRKNLYDILNSDRDSHRVRTIIFLDTALMDYMRKIIEARINTNFKADTLIKLLGLTIDNWMLTNSSPSIIESKRHLDKLIAQPLTPETALHIYSLIGKISRLAAGGIDYIIKLLQEKAEYLGRAFTAEDWTIVLFAEEIARSQIEFIVSILIKYLEPKLRQLADLGSWQVIAGGSATGRICVVPTISDLSKSKVDTHKSKVQTDPLVVIIEEVFGNEEPPQGVVAIITEVSVDIVSHLAIRARNRGIVFVACYSPEIFLELQSKDDKIISIQSDSKGGILISEDIKESDNTLTAKTPIAIKRRSSKFQSYIISESEFTDEFVGGKSLNLKYLRSKIPQWIALPSSIAVPFGVFENILSHESNIGLLKRYMELQGSLGSLEQDVLRGLRDTIIKLNIPSEMVESLDKALGLSNLKSNTDFDSCLMCIKKVFASIWNDRAYQGRLALGIKHSDIQMAVLIQEIIDAQYAFVIHTQNPVTGNIDEVYAEVVAGLGETLVGNYPGTSLGFIFNKIDKTIKIVSYPNKETGLYGSGLIFRSDSNAEDLQGYSGAGLYDSISESMPTASLINYSEQRLLWDIGFRTDIIVKIAEIGMIIEGIFGQAQDIEGVFNNQGQYYVVQSRPQV